MNPRTSFIITGFAVMVFVVVFIAIAFNIYPVSLESNPTATTAKDYISIHYRTRTAQGGCDGAGCCEFMGEYKGVSGFRCLEYKEYWISNGELNKPVNLSKEGE